MGSLEGILISQEHFYRNVQLAISMIHQKT